MAIWSQHNGIVKIDATDAAVTPTAYNEIVSLKFSGGTFKHGELYTLASIHSESTLGGVDPLIVDIEVPVDPKSSTSLYSVLHAWQISATKAARTVIISFPDGTTGSKQVSGEFHCIGTPSPFEPKAGEANPATASFKLKLTGSPTWSTLA